MNKTKWNAHIPYDDRIHIWLLEVTAANVPQHWSCLVVVGFFFLSSPNAHTNTQVNYATLLPLPLSTTITTTTTQSVHNIDLCYVAWKLVLFAHLINYISRNRLFVIWCSFASLFHYLSLSLAHIPLFFFRGCRQKFNPNPNEWSQTLKFRSVDVSKTSDKNSN